MFNTKADKAECLEALSKSHEDKTSFELVKIVINDYFTMLEHMKETSLYDVFMYEKHIVKGSLEPLKILTYENKDLKKEVNELRKKLGLKDKYKIKI